MTESFNQFLSILTILTIFLSVFLMLTFFVKKIKTNKLSLFLKKYSYGIIFMVSTGGVFSSLLYSEVIGYTPCILCWWQRIFLYPIAILSSVALIKKDRSINHYFLTLSIPGALIAIYQSIIQMPFVTNPFLCTGVGGDCSAVYFTEFGFVTIPLMAFSVFLLITLLSVLDFRNNKIISE